MAYGCQKENVEICNQDMLQFLLCSVYKNFGFSRDVSDCFGLNVYTGKRDADFIRPSPKMSKAIIAETEYYRDNFDPTFLPLVYKIINSLTVQATAFQRSVDPFYDRFLVECFHHDRCTLKEEISACGKEDGTKKVKVSKKLTPGKSKGCNRLSILTAGNSKCCGFANVGHVDGDLCDPWIQDAAIDVS